MAARVALARFDKLFLSELSRSHRYTLLFWSPQQLQQAHTPIYPKDLNDESTPNAMIKPVSTEVTMEARRLLSFSTPRASQLR